MRSDTVRSLVLVSEPFELKVVSYHRFLATRCSELAVQIKEECDKFGASSEIKNTVVYGGVKKHTQLRDLQAGVEILIATPGRLIDHLQEGNTNLKRVTYLVLDEADRM